MIFRCSNLHLEVYWVYIKYFAYFANNLFLHIVIRLFIFGFHHFEI
ncbi:hypothetical protein L9H10_002355 [Klebsiella pneumoniae]